MTGDTQTNETRADLGLVALEAVAMQTGEWDGLPAVCAVESALAYIAHACDRVGLNPAEMFADALRRYAEERPVFDGPPPARRLVDGDHATLAEAVAS